MKIDLPTLMAVVGGTEAALRCVTDHQPAGGPTIGGQRICGPAASRPKRLVCVVDRRAVVDQATQFAERLRQNMPANFSNKLRPGEGDGLPISTLHGGFADNRCWLEDPPPPMDMDSDAMNRFKSQGREA